MTLDKLIEHLMMGRLLVGGEAPVKILLNEGDHNELFDLDASMVYSRNSSIVLIDLS